MQNNTSVQGVVLSLDVGDVRIGVARAHSIARLPEPIEVIDRNKTDALARIIALIKEYDAEALVIGLPALPSGDEGPQAASVRAFAKELQGVTDIPQVFVDESYTSAEADTYLATKSWKHQVSNDALAACLLLERYFTEHSHV